MQHNTTKMTGATGQLAFHRPSIGESCIHDAEEWQMKFRTPNRQSKLQQERLSVAAASQTDPQRSCLRCLRKQLADTSFEFLGNKLQDYPVGIQCRLDGFQRLQRDRLSFLVFRFAREAGRPDSPDRHRLPFRPTDRVLSCSDALHLQGVFDHFPTQM